MVAPSQSICVVLKSCLTVYILTGKAEISIENLAYNQKARVGTWVGDPSWQTHKTHLKNLVRMKTLKHQEETQAAALLEAHRGQHHAVRHLSGCLALSQKTAEGPHPGSWCQMEREQSCLHWCLPRARWSCSHLWWPSPSWVCW